ncbi:class I SAM-dependent methyltransferase [Aquisalimonas asiatica]|uniref:Putative rRNA methylase n=1 Tax=Aquisalimonas asiatica TaxID=406100 RepID=A0A1H8Q5B9_9GAMM|nr:class I SAM-dependent methyltransferase [Aquisalimonas asiatica]SEO49435.1 Putative rRNA methylase [Aquisalimonas asiatica]
MKRRPLTALVHELLEPLLHEGAVAVDATAGNGHDTVFLAGGVGDRGQVYALDIQDDALANTRRRLEQGGLVARVRLIRGDHASLLDCVGHENQGRVAAITFNLGYLPGGDRSRVTSAATTIPALRQATTLLAPGGRMTILAYVGHAGGRLEASAVEEWANALGAPFTFREVRPPGTPEQAPRLLLIDRD